MTSETFIHAPRQSGPESLPLPVYEFIGAETTIQGDPVQTVLNRPSSPPIDALYLHIPYCFHKCHYCDFYSVVGRDEQNQSRFTQALIQELADRFDRLDACNPASPSRPDTVFAGGGTPTLLKQESWHLIIQFLRGRGILDRVTEFTVEANPETVTPGLMAALAEGGVTRLSVGAQTFNTRHLKTLERWHDPASVGRAVQAARSAGLARINLDLIFAIPGQTLSQFDEDLSRALDLEPDHLSCYGLTYEPNTALTTRRLKGQVTACDETVERAMYEHVMDRLAAEGFEHYEVSAWARPSQRCRHNLHYWRNANWLGVGPGAASHVDGVRWRNKPHLDQYIDSAPNPPVLDVEHPDPQRQNSERLMLGLRLREGVDAAWFDRAFSNQADETDALTHHGLIERADDRLRLTRRGLLVADDVIGRLLNSC